MSGVTYSRSGPFFDPVVRDGTIRHYCGHTEGAIGDDGVSMVQAYLPGSYRRDRPDPHPGLYESSIHTERSVVDHLIITDTPVVYGPWLEGVGSRNYPVTRFAGYHTFRRVSQLLDSMAEVKADSELTPYVERLNA